MACTAMGERRVAGMQFDLVEARWGAQGLDHMLLLLAEDIVQHAAISARNPFARVVPEQALTPDQLEAARERVLGEPEPVSDASDSATLCERVAAYLNAVQRDDTDGQKRVLTQIRNGRPGDLYAVREITLELAALYSPDAHTPPTPPPT
ncbi:hypothetical protein SLUN_00500 [Streptomyces lunaelactis]|uniref:Uncharacterized protein n=1 Tax=Streptomyces lunaelactis TaxID=1535768 RepID=A0A2R4SVT4_9ACTN|nr:hypothetical protein SLUN_00500 [Streptomyces lunaelactis]